MEERTVWGRHPTVGLQQSEDRLRLEEAIVGNRQSQLKLSMLIVLQQFHMKIRHILEEDVKFYKVMQG